MADGSPNPISIPRLKDKIGTVGVPTGELIFDDAEAPVDTARRESFGVTLDTFPMMHERLIWLQVDLAATVRCCSTPALDEHERTADPEHALRFRTLSPIVNTAPGEQNVDFAPSQPSRCSVGMAASPTSAHLVCFATPR